MQAWHIILIVVLFLMVDFVVIGAVFSMASAPLKELAAKFPPVPPAPDAVFKRFQSFRFNSMNMGGCIHAAADENYLHLTPARFARWFGVRDLSIPWNRVCLRGKRSRRSLKAEVEGVTIIGPAWCMSLASGPDGSGKDV